jgi:hypothetical protein
MNSPVPVAGVLGLFDESGQSVSGLDGKRPVKGNRPARNFECLR